jgi:hypothetical protein
MSKGSISKKEFRRLKKAEGKMRKKKTRNEDLQPVLKYCSDITGS